MIDQQTQIRMRLLVKDAGFAVVVFCDVSNNRYLLLPLEDSGKPEFTGAIEECVEKGFASLGVIALSISPDGEPLIEDEPMPGVSPNNMQQAKAIFRDKLIEAGILTPEAAKG